MDYVFPPPATPSISVAGRDERFPVRRIFCVGRNYAAHAREMGRDPVREPPFFFCKPSDAIVGNDKTIPYPPDTENLHYEAELVVAIGKDGVNIPAESGLSHVWGYAIGNDLTRRDLQLALRKLERPWDWGKAFDRSAVIGPVHSVEDVGHPDKGAIKLTINGDLKQTGDLNEMIWSVPEVIAAISRSMTLRQGDLIMTGTPAGVGPMVPGDCCVVSIAGLGTLTTRIGPRA